MFLHVAREQERLLVLAVSRLQVYSQQFVKNRTTTNDVVKLFDSKVLAALFVTIKSLQDSCY